MKKTIIGIIIGIVIGSASIVIGANYLYNAKEVSYKSTTVEAAINNLYDVSDLKLKLLWTNPNPSVNFDAQTITLSSDDYDYLKIYYIWYLAGSNTVYMQETLKNKGTYLEAVWDAAGTMVFRQMTANNNSLTFSNATKNGSVRNDAMIPLYIYGGKF